MGHIYILGTEEDGDIRLQVTDDGAGMTPERLQQVTRSIEQGERVGFGLSTIHERLRLMFGEPYGLTIHSRPGVGTTVTARIPWRTEEKEEPSETSDRSDAGGGAAAGGLRPAP